MINFFLFFKNPDLSSSVNFSSLLIIIISWGVISYLIGQYSKKDIYINSKIDYKFKIKQEIIKLVFVSISSLVIYFTLGKFFVLTNLYNGYQYILFFIPIISFSIFLRRFFLDIGRGKNYLKKVLILGNKIQFSKIKNWSINSSYGDSYEFIRFKKNIINDEFYDIVLFEQEYKNNKLTFLLKNGYRYKSPSQWFSEEFQKIPSEFISDNEILRGTWDLDKKGFSRRLKRLGDIMLSLIILFFSLPIILLASILIFLEDKGPILYSQTRTGHRGRVFKIFKLRTMFVGAENGKPQWAKRNDKRITKIGNLLRKTRIDELPQLISVLIGDMSLIGPRPERKELEKMIIEKNPNYLIRYSFLPGLSGWAQVNYPYGSSIKDTEEKLSYDIFYIKNYSLWLDFLILIKTIKLVMNASGSTPKN